MPGTAIADLADDLLTVAAETLTQGAPQRQYVSQGEPPFDSAQLTVHLVRLQPKLMDPKMSKCAIIWLATLAVVLVRCALVADDAGNPPSADDLNEQNLALAVDAWDLGSGLTAAWKSGEWPSGGSCEDVTWLPLEPFTPGVQGGLTGWRQSVQVQL